jgi:hypothetical protein
VAGFRCSDAFWSTEANTRPQEISARVTTYAEAATNLPEAQKNRLLASAILGSSIAARPARISPPKPALDEARSLLRQKEVDENQYWVVCAGARPGLEIKTGEELGGRSPESQRKQISHLSFWEIKRRPASIDRTRAALPENCRHFNLAQEPPRSLTTLGIIALFWIRRTRLGPM